MLTFWHFDQAACCCFSGCWEQCAGVWDAARLTVRADSLTTAVHSMLEQQTVVSCAQQLSCGHVRQPSACGPGKEDVHQQRTFCVTVWRQPGDRSAAAGENRGCTLRSGGLLRQSKSWPARRSTSDYANSRCSKFRPHISIRKWRLRRALGRVQALRACRSSRDAHKSQANSKQTVNSKP